MTDHESLLATYGSPAYVYDLDRVDRAREELVAALPSGATLYYSLKANPHVDVVAALVAGGARPEISSTGELAAALAAGGDPAHMLYTGPGKTAAEIGAALDAGVRTLSVESPADLHRVAAVARRSGRTARCLLRVNGGEAAGHAGMRMTGESSQFGSDIEVLLARRDELHGPDSEGAEIVGFHFYPVTNAGSGEVLLAEFTASIRTAARLRDELGVTVSVLDLGGGFACPFAVTGDRPAYPDLRAGCEAELDRSFPGWRAGDVEIAFESGRHLVGDAGTLLCTVTDVKLSRGARFVVVDTGIHHLGGLSGIGRLLPLSAEPVVSAAEEPGPVTDRARLVGPLCTPADTLGRGTTELPAVRPGQVLAIPNVGAYGATASLVGFLSRPAAVEICRRGAEVVSASRLELVRTPVPAGGAAALPEAAPPTAVVDVVAGTPSGGTGDTAAADVPWDERFPQVLRSVLPRLSGPITPRSGLRSAGLDSLALVELLVRLEETYAVTIPDDLLTPEVFETAAGVWDVLDRVRPPVEV
ncbi:phosphopantetheine-binding protein [Pseudonocardia alni]|uniref:phosphopantetheine-binding protein n=1 Tax=Pseudonocardia alni TaxID=33907 RepID=UPI0036C105DC